MFRITTTEARLLERIDQLETDLRVKEREIVVLEAERDSMAAVIARDRARIQAESAAYARQRAELESHESTR